MHDQNETIRFQNAKKLWRVCNTEGAVTEALNHIEMLLQTYEDKQINEPKYIRQALWISFVIAYCRPFTNNDKIGKESTKVVPHTYKALHDEVFQVHRHKAIAHTDPSEADLNFIAFQKHSTALYPLILRKDPEQVYVEKCHCMVKEVALNISKLVEKRLENFPSIKTLPNGDYMFTFNSGAGNEWSPYKHRQPEV